MVFHLSWRELTPVPLPHPVVTRGKSNWPHIVLSIAWSSKFPEGIGAHNNFQCILRSSMFRFLWVSTHSASGQWSYLSAMSCRVAPCHIEMLCHAVCIVVCFHIFCNMELCCVEPWHIVLLCSWWSSATPCWRLAGPTVRPARALSQGSKSWATTVLGTTWWGWGYRDAGSYTRTTDLGSV